MQKEKIDLFKVYKQDGKYHATDTRDVEGAFGLYGFLKCIVKDMEEQLVNTFDDFDYFDEEKKE